MKVIGIVCDNYKMPEFRKALTGYKLEETPFNTEMTTIRIKVEDKDFEAEKNVIAVKLQKVQQIRAKLN